MNLKDFKQAGHWPTLLAAFLYFDIGFMAWTSLGPLMVYVTKPMNLSVDEKFTLVAIPVLSGALLRIRSVCSPTPSAPRSPAFSRRSW